MKKAILFLMAIASLSTYAQKKKSAAKKSVATTKTVLAKSDNLSAELSERKTDYRFYVLNAKDTLTAKTIDKKNGAPSDVKITPFTAAAVKLCSIVWNEKKTIGDAKAKLENILETHTEIWNLATKSKVFENTQMVDNITEIVWIDPNKTASKTVEKIKRDGAECTITKEGNIVLKNKTQESKLKFDPVTQKFVASK